MEKFLRKKEVFQSKLVSFSTFPELLNNSSPERNIDNQRLVQIEMRIKFLEANLLQEHPEILLEIAN